MNTAATLPVDLMFRIANSAALLAWVALVALPRWPLLRRTIQLVVVLGLSLLYALLTQLYFFDVQGGGFFSLAAVQQLFTSPAVALAGWVHYLAFDLFVGLWIAQRADHLALSRWLQAPLLVTTFMFGPIGLLLFAAVLAVHRWRLPGGPANTGSPP
jgi:Domain of unknown function (DUF4281)